MIRQTKSTLAAVLLVTGLTLGVSGSWTTSAHAQNAMMTQSVALNSDTVGRFVASFPEVRALSETLEQEFDVPRSDSATENLGAFMQYQGAMARMNSIVGQHGFSSFMDWMQVMSSVVSAYTFAREGGGVDDQMAQAIAQIESNPNLTEAQKNMMRQQMAAASQSLTAIKPPQENIDAVSPYAEELKALFEDD